MRRLRIPRAQCLMVVLLCSAQTSLEADEPGVKALGDTFQRHVRPLVVRYCQECHSGNRIEAEIDLTSFASLAEVRKRPQVWQKVGEMLESRQMPPQEALQPTAAERERLHAWVRQFLTFEAQARAGDPGRVVLRRLNNAEYTYTLRDLTGIAGLDPAREFPVDGAAGEGFTNTGGALVMSPALVTKYLDAAKQVAGHAVLLPEGFRFSPRTTRRDWTNEVLARIRALYREHTVAGGASQVNLQGIVFNTNDGGRLAVEPYLAATLAERAALTDGSKSIEGVAQERRLNAKYLGILWSTLNDDTRDKEPSLLLDALGSQWRAAKPDGAAPLAAEIGRWQKALWRFASIGHIGKLNGPKAWQEAVTPLAARQEVRLKVPASQDQNDVTLYLVAGDAGDGNEHDYAVWERPRLVAPGRADVLLRDVLDPALFGKHPRGSAVEADSLCVQSPSAIEVRLPAALAEGCELVATGTLHGETGAEGSVQFQVLTARPQRGAGLMPAKLTETNLKGAWTSNNRLVSHDVPIIVADGSAARRRFEAAFDDFRRVFPAALCYTKIVPVDEVVTLTLFYREDDHLARLMLDAAQQEQLNRLWDELHYVSHDALTLVDAFEQLWQYATQDADPKVFEPLRKPIHDRAAAFRRRLLDTEPKHLEALLAFASRAYRRPLAAAEAADLRALYRGLRTQDLPHDEALRLTLARVLVAPAFLYRIEKPVPGAGQGPVSAVELAGRLSYFLWSSQPDEELRQAALDSESLVVQTRRLLRDAKARRLATEFACQWLHIYDFDRLDEKSERHFPTFAGLRGDMYEESIQFFTQLFQNNGSVLDILDADYTLLNEALAQHYGIPGVRGDQSRRVEGVKKFSRGGVLAQATTLATQSGASRTSPILRGNWVSEVLLGEQLPRPPKDVPRLPDDETATAGLTVRQLVERHTRDAKCAVCHARIDPLGFALEGFDAIGRRRDKVPGAPPLDTRVKTIDGAEFADLEGLRTYLLTTRRAAFLRQFCRKLLGYALGRGVQLSDEPLLDEMQAALQAHEYQIGSAVETIVLSPQFRDIRGRETAYDE